MKPTKLTDALLGMAVGDALGVPVEFSSRASLQHQPVTTMQGYGTHNQPPGTWSDDSSLAFCLAESLCHGYDLADVARRCVRWYREGYWTPHGRVFDIGIATSAALHRVAIGISPLLSGGTGEEDNGNGSLMRILPLVFYLKGLSIDQRFRVVAEVSGITHGHIRSIFACFLYCEYTLAILGGAEKRQALQDMQAVVNGFVSDNKVISDEELNRFHRLLEAHSGPYEIRSIDQYGVVEIASSGYVLHTLEASLWCLLTTDTYAEAVLKAVNLGSDTDTTACVTGGLAGLYYGADAIPADWLNTLVRKSDIIALGQRLSEKLSI